MKIKLVLIILILSIGIFAQQDTRDREWNKPVEPFRIIGNVYYVGAAEITSFLITTPKGHILLDGGFAETAPQIKENIAKLGFKPGDVKILLNSQAHYDHAGGLAELKRLTGAQMLASAGDKILLENGGRNDFAFDDRFPYEPVKTDRIIKDGERIKLGGVTLKTIITPGHTKGCTSFVLEAEESGKKYRVVFVGSTSVPGYQLVDNPKYPNIIADYEKTFRILKKLEADVFLVSHGAFFKLTEKTEKIRLSRSPNPFIDPQGYRDFLTETEKAFRDRIKEQSK
jgi:metallo-beta-lactamase class B